MKYFLTIIFIFISMNLNAQDCIDRTKEIRSILRSKKVTSYDAKVVGACIKNNTLYVTLIVDGNYTIALRNLGLTSRQVGYVQTLQPYFESVELVFKKFPEINDFVMYYVDYEKVTDSYGNFKENKKIIHMTLGMFRETANKINWKYINANIKAAIIYKDEEFKKIIGMLDVMEINSNE